MTKFSPEIEAKLKEKSFGMDSELAKTLRTGQVIGLDDAREILQEALATIRVCNFCDGEGSFPFQGSRTKCNTCDGIGSYTVALKESAGGGEKHCEFLLGNTKLYDNSKKPLESGEEWREELKKLPDHGGMVKGEPCHCTLCDWKPEIIRIFEAQVSRHQKEILSLRKELGESFDEHLGTIKDSLKTLS